MCDNLRIDILILLLILLPVSGAGPLLDVVRCHVVQESRTRRVVGYLPAGEADGHFFGLHLL